MLYTKEEVRGAEAVFRYFEDISKIPRGSGNHGGIVRYLVDFAKAHGLAYVHDGADNVIIRKAASAGMENRPTVVLQGHTDMVAVKTADCKKDMEKDGLDLFRDGDFLRAKGTSLGADDGTFVAYALAVLSDDTLVHPAIEALFTSDEEIGLLGAAALDPADLRGRTVINLDCGGEGVFTVGCAGGVRCDSDLPMTPAPVPMGRAYRVSLSGLTGGHSGVEIGKGRANALHLLADLLYNARPVRIAAFDGGTVDNAIPREAEAVVVTDALTPDVAERFLASVKDVYGDTDPDLTLDIEECPLPAAALTEADSDRVLTLFESVPNGVVAMSRDIEGLVETSLNAGVAHLGTGGFALTVSVRSAVEAEKRTLVGTLKAATEAVRGTFSTRGDYPAWEYRKNSPLREKIAAVYRKMYGRDARFETIHAGLECGIFAGKMPDMDAVAMGPDCFDEHSTEEHLSVSSTVRVYEFLVELLRSF